MLDTGELLLEERVARPLGTWETLMDIDVAEKLSRLMLRLSANLDQSIAYVRDNCSESEFEAYRRVAGKIMGDIYIDIEEKLWREHPTLRPQAMDGPYIVDDSVYELNFYCNNGKDGAV